jgi:hypothetical protein
VTYIFIDFNFLLNKSHLICIILTMPCALPLLGRKGIKVISFENTYALISRKYIIIRGGLNMCIFKK